MLIWTKGTKETDCLLYVRKNSKKGASTSIEKLALFADGILC